MLMSLHMEINVYVYTDVHTPTHTEQTAEFISIWGGFEHIYSKK